MYEPQLRTKIMTTNTLKIKNVSGVELHGLGPGETTTIAADEKGVPLDSNWRRRFRDNDVSTCVEIVKPTKAREGK